MMNNQTLSKYLSGRDTPLASYSLADYIKGDIAISIPGTLNDVLVASGCLVALCGFNINLSGTGYLITLIAVYIVREKFDMDEALLYIAQTRRSDPSYIRNCIEDAVRLNDKFRTVISSLLGTKVDSDFSLESVLEMFGAAYVIYYNYAVDAEAFDFDAATSVFNIWSIAKNEQRKNG